MLVDAATGTALLAADLLGSEGAAGLPIALITLGSAIAAWAGTEGEMVVISLSRLICSA